jgi:hypothetical protein
MWMDEKWTLNALLLMFHNLIYFMPSPPFWGGPIPKYFKLRTQKASIGLSFITLIYLGEIFYHFSLHLPMKTHTYIKFEFPWVS